MKFARMSATIFVVLSIACSVTAQESLETLYWRVLNEGHDMRSVAPTVEQLVFPGSHQRPVAAVRAELLAQLRELARGARLPNIVNDRAGARPRVGADWPSLGGNPAHTGATSEPGPQSGLEAWRYPIGWPWDATPLVHGQFVYTATPALDHVAMCLDRVTGEIVWQADNPPRGINRRGRAASEIISLDANTIALFRNTFDGWPRDYRCIDTRTGKVLRQFPARAQETKNQGPEAKPEQLVAFRSDNGNQVMVKSLLTGRTWWQFPTGDLSDHPLLAYQFVFAPGEDGTLWALNLWGAQRVAWHLHNTHGWGSTPTEHGGVLYVGDNGGTVHAIAMTTGKLLWQTHVSAADPRSRRLFTTPRYANERVYVGSTDGHIYALDAKSGKIAWRYNCGDWIRSRPFVQDGMVYAATLDGKIFALRDQRDQARLAWSSRASRFPIYTDITGDDTDVVVATSDFDLVAFQRENGALQWRQSLIPCTREADVKICSDSMPDIMQAPVIVAKRRVIAAGRTGFVVAVDAATGQRAWRFECGGRVSAAPTTRDGRVFVGQVGGNRRFYALDVDTGKPIWSRTLGEVWAPPECDSQQLFVGNKHNTLYCLDPATGAVQWTRQFGAGVYPAPTLDADTVYTGSWDGHYYALDRTNGQVRWAFSMPGRTYHLGGRPDSAAPILVNGKVIVQCLGTRVTALQAKDGKEIWHWRAPPLRIFNVTAATNGSIAIVSTFGNAYEFPFGIELTGLDIDTGRELWQIPGPGGLTSPVFTAGNRFCVGSMGSPFLCGFQLHDDTNRVPTLLWRRRTGGVMYESLPAVSGTLAFFLSNDGWLRAVK